MAQVLIIGIFTLLCLQLAAGQTAACVDALNTLAANAVSCTATLDNPLIICTGQCQQYYDVMNNCDQDVS